LTDTTMIVEHKEDNRRRGTKVPVRINYVDGAVSSVEHEGGSYQLYLFSLL
jgi:hypothetical protein